MLKNLIIKILKFFKNELDNIRFLKVYKNYYVKELTELDCLINEIWPQTKEISFSKKNYHRRIIEELFIFDKYKTYLTDIDIFVDIGANVGMTSLAFQYFSKGKSLIVSIEPMVSCSEILNNLSNRLPNFSYLNCGVGKKKGQALLNVSTSSPTSQASSFLNFSAEYKSHAKHARSEINKIKVPIRSIEDIMKNIFTSESSICLHIDVEGFEKQVLEGGQNFLPNVKVIIVEIANGLFEKQGSANQIISLLSHTHILIGTLGAPMMANGKILLQDYLFVRK